MHNAVIIKSFEGVSIKVPIKTEQSPPSRHPSREGNRSRKKNRTRALGLGSSIPNRAAPDPPPSRRQILRRAPVGILRPATVGIVATAVTSQNSLN